MHIGISVTCLPNLLTYVQSAGIGEKSCTWMQVWRKAFYLEIGMDLYIASLYTYTNIKIKMINFSFLYVVIQAGSGTGEN